MSSSQVDVDVALLNGLAAKIDGLALSDRERSVLDAMLERAAPEVEGFGVVFEIETTFKGTDEELQLTDSGKKWGGAMGFHIHQNPYIGETEKNRH